jgi:hypothetical protein
MVYISDKGFVYIVVYVCSDVLELRLVVTRSFVIISILYIIMCVCVCARMNVCLCVCVCVCKHARGLPTK